MNRLEHINRFYQILNKIEDKISKKQLLLNISGKTSIPNRGVYFFFEPGEFRENNDMRVVRVGTHAITEKSKTTLWHRLRNHRGNINGSHINGGNHRGSIFRLHVGTAIVSKENIDISSWGVGSSASGDIKENEYFVEQKVSNEIRNMPFLWVKIDDPSSVNSDRKYIERNSIALLSNYHRQDKVDKASENWLGNYVMHEKIRNSGLWNVEHVDEEYNPEFLNLLEKYVEDM